MSYEEKLPMVLSFQLVNKDKERKLLTVQASKKLCFYYCYYFLNFNFALK